MTTSIGSVPRRVLLQGAGAGLLAGLSALAPAHATPAEGTIWSKDYWAKKGDVFVYFISGAKVRNPAAAQALIERVS